MSQPFIDPLLYERAHCKGAPDGELDPKTWTEAARAIRRWCSHCPVVARCHVQAELNRDEGVWGGRWRTSQHDGRDRGRVYSLAELEAGPRRRAS